jgi:phage-related protein
MRQGRFRIRQQPAVTGFIANLAKVPRLKVERDLEKLETRGLDALPPLTGNVEGPVWELRSKVAGYGLYRIFYYRDGPTSFHAFYAYQKKDNKLPNRIREEVLSLYEQFTGRKL